MSDEEFCRGEGEDFPKSQFADDRQGRRIHPGGRRPLHDTLGNPVGLDPAGAGGPGGGGGIGVQAPHDGQNPGDVW